MAKWENLSSRGRVVDRRSARLVGGGLGVSGLAVVLLLTFLGGGDVVDVLPDIANSLVVQQDTHFDPTVFEGEDDYERFAATVLGSTDTMWQQIFASANHLYTPPTLVLFRDATTSACGGANSQVGPHYCPLDQTIYLDETFFDELEQRFGAEGGDVAEAYVIAHEAAHHAQHVLGITDQVYERRNQSDANQLSINTELQADCFAGLWAHSIKDKDVLLPGEIEEAMNAAAAVGDDRIQAATTGRIHPESWTHGSSEQRMQWFTTGYTSGTFEQCDTFND